MDKQRWIIFCIGILGMLATFMPWVNAPIVGSITGMNDDGWITFVLFGIAVWFSLLGNRKKPLRSGYLYGTIIPGLGCTIIGIWRIIKFNSELSEVVTRNNVWSDMTGQPISISFGLYIVILAGLSIALAAYFFRDKLAIDREDEEF